jgi:hypothetical protein
MKLDEKDENARLFFEMFFLRMIKSSNKIGLE